MFLDGEILESRFFEMRCGECGDRVAVIGADEIVPIALRQSRLMERVLCFECEPERAGEVPVAFQPGLWNCNVVCVDNEVVVYENPKTGSFVAVPCLSSLPHFNAGGGKRD